VFKNLPGEERVGNTDKIKILLQHWIDHNKEHAGEYSKWQESMVDEGYGELAGYIGAAVQEMGRVNEFLEKALEEAGGSLKEGGGHDHGHGHGHHHHH
jgi:aryl-alcohol dehydrogenase-like predicted oxidoreductase